LSPDFPSSVNETAAASTRRRSATPGICERRATSQAVDDAQLKALFITGYAENAVVGNGLLEQGMQIITKPFAIDALGDQIRKMLDT
jgi:hypothetical protein